MGRLPGSHVKRHCVLLDRENLTLHPWDCAYSLWARCQIGLPGRKMTSFPSSQTAARQSALALVDGDSTCTFLFLLYFLHIGSCSTNTGHPGIEWHVDVTECLTWVEKSAVSATTMDTVSWDAFKDLDNRPARKWIAIIRSLPDTVYMIKTCTATRHRYHTHLLIAGNLPFSFSAKGPWEPI